MLAPGPRRAPHEIELANEACAGEADSHMHLERDPVFHPDLAILVLEQELGGLAAGRNIFGMDENAGRPRARSRPA